MLEDANIAWDPDGRGSFRIVLGQFKVAGGRQQLTSSGNQQFVDRSNVSDEYWRGRDTGVAIQGVLFSNKFEYRVGMSNGAAAIGGGALTRPTNDNDSFAYNARLMWQPNGNQSLVQRSWVSGALYSEADFESTTVPLYALAINLEANSAFRTTDAVDARSLVAAVDGVFKYKGLSATGEYIWRQRETEADSIFHSNGWYFQAGKMLNRPRTWEVAGRYGEREVNSLLANDDVAEMRVGLNYYYRRHSLKVQVDAGQLETGRGTTPGVRKDRELRVQTQFIF
jgi:phosphate-selective porin OprO/OprP